MKIYIVLEKHPRGTRISKVFAKVADAVAWRTELQGSDEYLNFDSAYKYWVEEWEVDGQAV